MAFSTTIHQVEKPVQPESKTPNNGTAELLMSLVLLTAFGAQMSKKTLRKLKRKLFWSTLKQKFTSLFQPKAKREVSDRTLLYIILGVVLLALLFIDVVLVLVLALIALILILLGVI